MITSEKVPSAYDMVDDMGDMAPRLQKLDEANRECRAGIVQLANEWRWGEFGSGADYVPSILQHVRGLQ